MMANGSTLLVLAGATRQSVIGKCTYQTRNWRPIASISVWVNNDGNRGRWRATGSHFLTIVSHRSPIASPYTHTHTLTNTNERITSREEIKREKKMREKTEAIISNSFYVMIHRTSYFRE